MPRVLMPRVRREVKRVLAPLVLPVSKLRLVLLTVPVAINDDKIFKK